MSTKNMPWSERMAASHLKRVPQMPDFWNHNHGLMFKAIEAMWKMTGEQKYFDYIKRSIDSLLDETGDIVKGYKVNEFKLDSVKSGRLLISLFKETGDERYKKGIYALKEHLRVQPRSLEGVYWHKQIMPYQYVLDGTVMWMLFAAEFEKEFNNPGCFDDIVNQILVIDRISRDEASGLYYQGFDESKKIFWADKTTGLSSCFWGRANAWFVYMLVELLDYLPEDHPSRFRIIKILSDLIAALVKVQDDETGVFFQILDQKDREGNYPESSATGLITYAMAKGIRKGYLKEQFMAPLKKAYAGMIKQFFVYEDDVLITIKDTCINVDLGAEPENDSSYEYYVTAEKGDNDFKAIASFIMTSIELEQMG